MHSLKNLKSFSIYNGLPKEVYIIFAAKIITSMGSFIVPLWALILTSKIGISKPVAGVLTAVLAVVQGLCLVFGGKFIDRLGRKKVLCFCQFSGAMLYFACSVIPISLITAGLIMAAASLYTTANPAIDALLADYTVPGNRKQAYSLTYFGANLGWAIGPILSGILFNNFLWLLFILNATSTLFSLTLILKNIKEPKIRTQNILKKEKSPDITEHFEALKLLLKRKELLFFIIFIGMFQFCIAEWSFLLPLQLTDYFKSNGARDFSLLITITAIVVVVFTPAATKLMRRFELLSVVALGGSLYGIAYIIFGLTKNYLVFVIGAIILTLGEILVSVNNNAFIAEKTPSRFRGRIYSIYQLTLKTFEGISPVIMGSVIIFAGYRISWFIVATTMFFASLFMYILSIKARSAPEDSY